MTIERIVLCLMFGLVALTAFVVIDQARRPCITVERLEP